MKPICQTRLSTAFVNDLSIVFCHDVVNERACQASGPSPVVVLVDRCMIFLGFLVLLGRFVLQLHGFQRFCGPLGSWSRRLHGFHGFSGQSGSFLSKMAWFSWDLWSGSKAFEVLERPWRQASYRFLE